jgi:putative phage-type endonuclease
MALRKDQVNLRLTGVSASDVAAVCGFSPWKGPHAVWLDKVGKAKPMTDNTSMERGRLFEEPIVRLVAGHEGIFVRNVGERQETIKSKRYPLAIATPDALASRKLEGRIFAVVEAKSPGENTWSHWIIGKKVYPPRYVIAQTQWQMAVLNVKVGFIGALVKSDLLYWRIEFDSRMFSSMYATVKKFWKNYVIKKIPPPVDFGNARLVKQFLKDFYVQKKDKIEFDSKLNKVAGKLLTVNGLISGYNDEKDKLENIIKDRIRESAGVKGDFWRATWRKSEDGSRRFNIRREK